MTKDILENFEDYFEEIEDPRIERSKLYPLKEILLVVLCGSICGAESWRDFVLFGREKLDFLREYFPFLHGIPCKNTFARVFSLLDPEQFHACFMVWVASLEKLPEEVIAIDGKTLRNSKDTNTSTDAIHMVSAFGTASRLVLGQEKVAEKSNEITAIPRLLDLLNIKDHIITIDAMGCQRSIAKKIQDKGADYVLALKGNQGHLNEDIRLFLQTKAVKADSKAISDQYIDVDSGHGRIETRKCIVSDQLDWLKQKPEWSGLRSIVMIEEIQETKEKLLSCEKRFFISSLPADAKKIAEAVRAHWSIENTLHWTLDAVFNEDQSRVRKDYAPQNMAIIRHIVLNMLNNAKKHFKKDMSIKGLRKKAGWGNTTLHLILQQSF